MISFRKIGARTQVRMPLEFFLGNKVLRKVMTGVFCNAAIRGAERDAEMAVQTLMLDKQRLDGLLGKLFQKMDSDGTGKLDITKFEAYYRDDEVRAVFEALDLGAHDAWTFLGRS